MLNELFKPPNCNTLSPATITTGVTVTFVVGATVVPTSKVPPAKFAGPLTTTSIIEPAAPCKSIVPLVISIPPKEIVPVPAKVETEFIAIVPVLELIIFPVIAKVVAASPWNAIKLILDLPSLLTFPAICTVIPFVAATSRSASSPKLI